MARTTTPTRKSVRRLRGLFPWVVALLMVLQLVRWGGVPQSNRLLFWAGVLLLVALLAALAVLTRALLQASSQRTSAEAWWQNPRLLAGMLLLCGVAIGVGAFWDEVWHREYGLPFGEDLFWRPHLLMYGGLLGVIVLAGGSLLAVLGRDLRGVWSRLRARPALALLVVLGAFLIYALPSDPIWHTIYGEDITAWSLPHLLLALNFSSITLVAVALLRTATPARPWRLLPRLAPEDVFTIVAFAFALNLLLQLLTTEWDNVRFVPIVAVGAFWARPEWLLPALLAALAALLGTLAVHASRLIGAATLTGIAALGFRWLMLQAFNYDRVSTDAWLLLLPPLLALDLLFLLRRRQGRSSNWWQSSLAVAAGTTVGTLPLLGLLLVYPRVGLGSLPAMVAAIAVSALAASWLGSRLGSWLATDVASPGAAPSGGGRWLIPVLGAALVGFVIWFIAGASPPV